MPYRAKRILKGHVLAMCMAFISCALNPESAHASPPNQWVWVSGSSAPNGSGTYGTKGTPSISNLPSARMGAASWVDAGGNLWLFGGSTPNGAGLFRLNDLWKFNPSNQTWTWVSGSNTLNPAGTYGSKGMPAASNTPGGRMGAVSWIDAGGHLWLFGGFGLDSGSGEGPLNDLWKFDPVSGNWTWIAGANTAQVAGTYGTLGAASPLNAPGSRSFAAAWIDVAGNFWLFGGAGCDATACGIGGNGSILNSLNDLWKFDPIAATWTWVGGSNAANATGNYGQKGTPAMTNMPAGRSLASTWTDCNGNLWLFGGRDAYVDSAGNFVGDGEQNDLWEYTPMLNIWTWVSGAPNRPFGAAPTYGTEGTAAASNVPGGRDGAAAWTDRASNLWLFGGSGLDSTFASTGAQPDLNDLWEFSPVTENWTWVGGSDVGGASSVFGTQGIASATTMPGARSSSTSWTDQSGNYWLFGGARSNGGEYFNDLWEFSPGASNPSVESGCPNAGRVLNVLPEFVTILFGITNDGGGIAITAGGKVIRVPPRSPDAIFVALSQNMGHVVNALELYQSTDDVAKGKNTARERKRKKALQMSIDALGKMQTSLKTSLRRAEDGKDSQPNAQR